MESNIPSMIEPFELRIQMENLSTRLAWLANKLSAAYSAEEIKWVNEELVKMSKALNAIVVRIP